MFKNEKCNKQLIIIIGIITAAMGSFLLFPQFCAENIFKLPYHREYDIILRHWGLLVGLGGIYTIISANNKSFRKPILSFIIIEKLFLVGIILINLSNSFAIAFIPAIIIDSISSVILIMILKSD